VQVLQAANTGLTSLQSLVDSAKSIANQALQTTIGYTSKSNVTAKIAGATSSDLRGTTTFASATALSNVLYSGAAGGVTPAVAGSTLGATAGTFSNATAVKAADGATNLVGTDTLVAGGPAATTLGASPAAGDVLTVNGHTITFAAGNAPAATAVPTGSGLNAAGGNIVTDGNGNSSSR